MTKCKIDFHQLLLENIRAVLQPPNELSERFFYSSLQAIFEEPLVLAE